MVVLCCLLPIIKNGNVDFGSLASTRIILLVENVMIATVMTKPTTR